jgi:hypothetical protein
MTDHKRIQAGAILAMILVALILAACGGAGGSATQSGGSPGNNMVTPLTGPEAEGDMAIKLPNGNTPCGVFNANGFGNRIATLADYPACKAPYYKVLCLDDKAQWQAANVSDVSLSPDKKQVYFTSKQDGTCGLFASQ